MPASSPTEILKILSEQRLSELALVGEASYVDNLVRSGWKNVFVVNLPFDVEPLARHGESLRRLALVALDIGDTGVRALAPLISLTSLCIENDHVDDDGARILASLTSLTSLHLNYNRIGAGGIRALASLTKLTSLQLNNNRIGAEGSRSLAALKSLTSLDLTGNLIGDEGARSLASLTALTSLRLSSNLIDADGARALSNLLSLKSLHLDHNRIGDDGARALASLTCLTVLSLSYNNIGEVGAHALASLSALTNLNLSYNNIENEGLRALATLKNLVSVSLGRNPITSLPKEVLADTDAQAIFAAFRRYATLRSRPLNEAKLLVVGNEAVGKTSLIRYLTRGKPRDPDEKKTIGITAHERIETRSWLPTGEGPRLNVWDFGGQEILHETHKFFLTDRSIYLLVLEDRREDDTSIYKWLKVIANRGGASPVIVVINKCDDGQPKLLLDETTIAREWPSVIGVLRTSCNSGDDAVWTIDRLKTKILEALAVHPRLSHVRDALPEPWRRVKEAVSLRARSAKVLTHQEFVRICESGTGADRIGDEHEQRALLRLLHDLGVVIANGVSGDVPAALEAVRLLDPNWLTGAIYKILTAALVVHQGGVFRREQLTIMLPPKLYPPSRWEFILSMMQLDGMGLCFPLPGSHDTYLVPEALPRNASSYDQWPVNSLCFRFVYDFLPSGLIPRLIVEAHQKVSETRWRSGAVFAAAGCQVLVRGNVDKSRIDILVTGPYAMQRSALNVILEDLRRVHELNRETKPQARIPLPDNPEATVSYDHLLFLEERHGPDYMHAPEGADREYSVGDLLEGVGRGVRSDPRNMVLRPRPHLCDVLIVTALKEELDALLAVTGTSWKKHQGYPTYYTCSLGGDDGLRLIAMRLTRMGGIKLAASAVPFIERFAPRCLAMCGVCAGHPYDTDLGDVILADRVFQHDEGKYKPEGFQGDLWVHANTDAWLYEAQELVGPASEISGYANASEEDARWWFLEKLLTAKNPMRCSALRRFFPDERRRPILETLERDALVQFEHGNFALTDVGRAAIHRYLQFDGTLVRTRPFHVHVGPIASGNAVEADGSVWTEMLGERKTLAIEMEAGALGELAHQGSLPFAIVKGVMDHADDNKTDRFKSFAARASAEVLCRFLPRVMRR